MNNSTNQFAEAGTSLPLPHSRHGKPGFFRRWGHALLATTALFTSAATSEAGAIRPGFNTTTLAANDDSSTGLVNIGFAINFLGASYSRLYINNNGNLTFDRALSAFTPAPIASAGMRIIAPFWADVDTRGAGSEPVRYGFGTGVVNGRNAFGATYKNVGYYNARADKLNSFQVVIVDRSDIGTGDFDLEFNYDKVQWETGNSSGGSGGVGGSSARVGFANGSASSMELAGSGTNGAFLDSNPETGLIYNSLNAGGVAGRYVFQTRGGVVVNAPPIANAGVDIATAANATVALNGGTSYDPEGLPLSFSWTQTGGASVTLSNPLSSAPTLTAPAGSYTFQLSVSDGMLSAIDTVVVTAGVPVATTRSATSITHNSALLQGAVNPAGVTTQYYFEYSSSGGAVVSTPVQTLAAGLSDSPVSAVISGLSGGTAYTFRVFANNTYGGSVGSTLSFTTSITPVIAPTATITSPANGASFPENTVVNITATASDSDGTVVRVEFFNGAVKIGEDTTAPYTQTLNGLSVGEHVLTARATDNSGATGQSAPVTIRVTSINIAPVARPDSGTTNEDVMLGNMNVLGNDTDANNDRLTVTSAGSSQGAVSINANGTLNFSPNSNFFGSATINYTISDGNGGTANSTVAISVTDVNDQPAPANDTASMPGNTTLSRIPVLANDSDVDGDILTVTAASSPNGAVIINADGTLDFTPAVDFTGAATIGYTVGDGNGGTASATVAVNVSAPNRAPVANNDAFVIAGNPAPYVIAVLGNDSDSDGDALIVSGATNGASGTVSTDGTRVTYAPSSGVVDDNFTYTIHDGQGGTATASVRIVRAIQIATFAASDVTPLAAVLNASLNPNGIDTALSFEYSTSPVLSTVSSSDAIAVGSDHADITTGIAVAGLRPNTRYYYRAVSTGSAGVFYGAIKTFLTPTIAWGPAGASTAGGLLDATRIPNSANATVFGNISGLNYDLVMTTAGLGGNGYTAITGTPAWWFEGSAPTADAAATVRFRFNQTGSTNPHGMMGVRFQIDDAEHSETISNFHYYTAAGERVYVPWNNAGIFTYSHTPAFGGNGSTVENGATYEGGTQSGKWVDVNLSGILVSGFEFQLRRRTISAGTVIMSGIMTGRETISVNGNFAPTSLPTDAAGFAVLPDYASMAVVRGTAQGATITQSPAAGTLMPAGKREVVIYAEDVAGNRASTGFNVTIVDKTAPVATVAADAPTRLVFPETIPNYANFVSFRDNVGVTRIVQSPAAGTATTVGDFPVSLIAYDAVGNHSAITLDVTVESPAASSAMHTNVASKGAAVAGAGTSGIPAGAVFKSFGVPSIDNNRAVAFSASWIKGTRGGVSIFAGNPAVPVATVAGQALGMSGAVFSRFLDPVLNGNGTQVAVAFVADVTGPGITTSSDSGVWTNFGGTLQLLAGEGAVAPGTGAQFKNFNSVSMVGDEVLFVAALTGTGISSANDVGVWRWTSATGLQLVLREGQTMFARNTVASFQMLANIAGSAGHGRNHLDAGYYSARVTFTNRTTAAVRIDFTGSEPVAFSAAESARPIVNGIVASSIGVPSGNTYGSAAFVAAFTGGSAIVASTLDAGGGSTNRILARRDQVAADTAKWFSFRDPVMNSDDGIAWVGKLSGATTASDDAVAFCVGGGAPMIVAREGFAAPGTTAVFSSFKSVALPDGSAGPVFSAALLVGVNDVTTANDIGLWVTNSAGELVLVCREGQPLEGRIVKQFSAIDFVAGSPGQSRSFNDTSDLLISVTFQDGGQSIVRVAIP